MIVASAGAQAARSRGRLRRTHGHQGAGLGAALHLHERAARRAAQRDGYALRGGLELFIMLLLLFRGALYMLSQTSLEALFNSFAAMQEEERGVARGTSSLSTSSSSAAAAVAAAAGVEDWRRGLAPRRAPRTGAAAGAGSDYLEWRYAVNPARPRDLSLLHASGSAASEYFLRFSASVFA